MSIVPQTSANIAFWHKMLVRSRGTVFCSNLMIYEDLATQSIDDGGLVTVAYDPRTPNSAELIAIIEGAGYGARAASVLLMLSLGISGSPNWNEIVNNASLMTVIWNNSTARGAVLNSAEAMAAVAGSANARNTLFANSAALNAFWTHGVATTRALSVAAFVTAVSGNDTAMDALLDSATNWTRVANQSANMNAIAGNTNFMNRIRANSSALTIMLKATIAIIAIAASANAVNSLIGDATSRNTLFASLEAVTAIANNTTGWAALWSNTAAMNALVITRTGMRGVASQTSPKTALKQVLQNATYRAAIIANADAKNGLEDASNQIMSQYDTGIGSSCWITDVRIQATMLSNFDSAKGDTVTGSLSFQASGLTDTPTSITVAASAAQLIAYAPQAYGGYYIAGTVNRYSANAPAIVTNNTLAYVSWSDPSRPYDLGISVRGIKLPA